MHEEEGLGFPQITEWLKASNIRSAKDKALYTELVYSAYRKWRRRLNAQARGVSVELVDVHIAAS